MDFIFQDFSIATAEGNGYQLAQTLSPELPAETLKIIWKSTNHNDARGYIRRNLKNGSSPLKVSNQEIDAWTDVYLSYWTAVGAILAVQGDIIAPGKPSWTTVYQAWKDMTLFLKRGYQEFGFEAWTIPCLYTAGKYLRVFAIKADDERGLNAADSGAANLGDDFDPEMEAHQTLEECARHLNGLFSLCLTDRAPVQESRKWAIYYIINLLFKTYFKLNKARLSRTILKNLHAYKGNMPQLDQFPKSQQVTFKYYEGVLFFLEENYVEAEKRLAEALGLCHKDAQRNKELILTYLIPCHLLTTQTLPTHALLDPYPRLQKLFLPLAQCIKRGDLYAFDQALKEGENEFVKRRIYLPLERSHDTCLRNLLRKVFIAGGTVPDVDPPTRRTRIPTAEFTAAISLSSKQQVDSDEVECLLANMIYKGFMKGYIARSAQFVVLSKKNDAFPNTGV
ncbi:cop9 signalosome complex subunit 12 [Diaporthe eres]|uniref:PCI domain-containing protein n=1 Tax=Diaporthe vaccinii TaxID=105482 RepID=A0ABR4EZI1_9PEZI|nr:cop9 signalosome complex subunit 12 [Diaporthe eres]